MEKVSAETSNMIPKPIPKFMKNRCRIYARKSDAKMMERVQNGALRGSNITQILKNAYPLNNAEIGCRPKYLRCNLRMFYKPFATDFLTGPGLRGS